MGGDVAREARQQPPHTDRVAMHPIHAVNIDTGDLIEIIAHGKQTIRVATPAQAGPPPEGDLLREIRDSQPRVGAWAHSALEKFPQRNATAAATCLKETHRAHPQTGDTAGAGVPRDVVRGGTAEPVKMNWPESERSSIARRT